MHWNWDIKDAMPYTIKMKTINFMGNLLYNAPYRLVLEAPLENLIRRLIMNAIKMPDRVACGSRTRNHPIRKRLVSQLGEVQKLVPDLENPTGIKLRDFYEMKYSTLGKKRQDILKAFLDFHKPDSKTKKNEFAHFCMPFLAIQLASKGGDDSLLVNNADLDKFISRAGHITLLDLYTFASKHYTNQEKAGISDGYSSGILNFTEVSGKSGKSLTLVLTPPGGNRMKCVGGECVDGAFGDWCTEDEEGNCTAGG